MVRNSGAGHFKDGELISGTPDLYYYNKDHLGSVRELTDVSGNILSQYNYSPYGQVMKFSENVPSDFQYAGYYYHAPSGLSLTLNRVYSAQLGRWINRDPIQESGGINLYCYAHNKPSIFTDITGLVCLYEDRRPKLPGDKSALDFLKEAGPLTAQDQTEYGGRLYRDPGTGRTYYTPPGSIPFTLDLNGNKDIYPLDHAPIPPTPPGMDDLGRIHTHIDSSGNSSEVVSGDPNHLLTSDPNKFSTEDLTNAKTTNSPSYLGAPNGTIERYDPGTGTTQSIGQWK